MAKYRKIDFSKREYDVLKQAVGGYPSLQSLVTKMDNAMVEKVKQEFGYFEALAVLAVYPRLTFDSKPSPVTIKQVNLYLVNEGIDPDMLVKAYQRAEKVWKGPIYFPTLIRNSKRLFAEAIAAIPDQKSLVRRPGFST